MRLSRLFCETSYTSWWRAFSSWVTVVSAGWGAVSAKDYWEPRLRARGLPTSADVPSLCFSLTGFSIVVSCEDSLNLLYKKPNREHRCLAMALKYKITTRVLEETQRPNDACSYRQTKFLAIVARCVAPEHQFRCRRPSPHSWRFPGGSTCRPDHGREENLESSRSSEGKWDIRSGQSIDIVMGLLLETRPCPSDKHSTHFRPVNNRGQYYRHSFIGRIETYLYNFYGPPSQFSCG